MSCVCTACRRASPTTRPPSPTQENHKLQKVLCNPEPKTLCRGPGASTPGVPVLAFYGCRFCLGFGRVGLGPRQSPTKLEEYAQLVHSTPLHSTHSMLYLASTLRYTKSAHTYTYTFCIYIYRDIDIAIHSVIRVQLGLLSVACCLLHPGRYPCIRLAAAYPAFSPPTYQPTQEPQEAATVFLYNAWMLTISHFRAYTCIPDP